MSSTENGPSMPAIGQEAAEHPISPPTGESAEPAARTGSRPRVRALCCRCGRIRTTTTSGGLGEPFSTDAPGAPRCLVWRKCQTCGERTAHAYLREDELRDHLEQLDPDHGYRRAIADGVAALEACEVTVIWLGEDFWMRGQVGELVQRLDSGTFSLRLNSAETALYLAAAVEAAWSLLLLDYRRDLGGWRSVAPRNPASAAYRYRMLLAP